MIKAVFMDIDNTILDFDKYIQTALKDGFQKFGLPGYHDGIYDVFVSINNGLWRDLEKGILTMEALFEIRFQRIFDALHISFDGRVFERFFADCLYDSAIPIDGAKDVLSYLKEKYILCAASNGPYDQQVNRLKRADMLDFFRHLFISGRVGASKPSEAFFTHCLTEVNRAQMNAGETPLTPDEIIMIGDSMSSDIAGARNMGMKTCFFDKHNKGSAAASGADYTISSLASLKTIL